MGSREAHVPDVDVDVNGARYGLSCAFNSTSEMTQDARGACAKGPHTWCKSGKLFVLRASRDGVGAEAIPVFLGRRSGLASVLSARHEVPPYSGPRPLSAARLPTTEKLPDEHLFQPPEILAGDFLARTSHSAQQPRLHLPGHLSTYDGNEGAVIVRRPIAVISARCGYPMRCDWSTSITSCRGGSDRDRRQHRYGEDESGRYCLP